MENCLEHINKTRKQQSPGAILFYINYSTYLHFKSCLPSRTNLHLLTPPHPPSTLPLRWCFPNPPNHAHLTRLAPPFTGASSHHRTKRLPLPLMLDKTILCHICSRSHESLFVYSLVGALVLQSSEGFNKYVIKAFSLESD